MDGHAALLLNHVRDVDGDTASHLIEDLSDFAMPDQQITDVLVIRQLKTKSLPYRFEGVAERSVTKVVNECGSQGEILSRLGTAIMIAHDLYQLSGCVKDPDAVGKSRMTGTGINKI